MTTSYPTIWAQKNARFEKASAGVRARIKARAAEMRANGSSASAVNRFVNRFWPMALAATTTDQARRVERKVVEA